MLAFVPVVVAVPVLTMVVTGSVMLALLYAIDEWWLPQQPTETNPKFHYFTRFVKWSRNKLTAALRTARKRVASSLSRAVLVRSGSIVRVLNGATELVTRSAGTFADEAQQIHAALHYLRHNSVPALINVTVNPVRQIALTARALATAATTTLTAVSIELADGLRALPWGVPIGLPNRVTALMSALNHLWTQFFEVAKPQLQRLSDELVPELRRDLEALARRVEVGIDNRLDALLARIQALESTVGNIVTLRLEALERAIDTLAAEIFEGVGVGLSALVEQVVALELAVGEAIPQRFAALQAELDELRLGLAAGIAAGLEAFTDRIVELERQVAEVIPQRIAALELAVEALVAEAIGDIGAGLTLITGRILELERRLSDVVIPQLDLVLGRIEALEARIENVVIPRMQALEDLLAPAAFGALVLATMTRIAPNLFCRNTTNVTRRICGLDENLLAQLLAGSLAFALVLDPRLIARLGQEFTGAIDGVIRQTADL